MLSIRIRYAINAYRLCKEHEQCGMIHLISVDATNATESRVRSSLSFCATTFVCPILPSGKMDDVITTSALVTIYPPLSCRLVCRHFAHGNDRTTRLWRIRVLCDLQSSYLRLNDFLLTSAPFKTERLIGICFRRKRTAKTKTLLRSTHVCSKKPITLSRLFVSSFRVGWRADTSLTDEFIHAFSCHFNRYAHSVPMVLCYTLRILVHQSRLSKTHSRFLNKSVESTRPRFD